jgi:hypothetical protein
MFMAALATFAVLWCCPRDLFGPTQCEGSVMGDVGAILGCHAARFSTIHTLQSTYTPRKRSNASLSLIVHNFGLPALDLLVSPSKQLIAHHTA